MLIDLSNPELEKFKIAFNSKNSNEAVLILKKIKSKNFKNKNDLINNKNNNDIKIEIMSNQNFDENLYNLYSKNIFLCTKKPKESFILIETALLIFLNWMKNPENKSTNWYMLLIIFFLSELRKLGKKLTKLNKLNLNNPNEYLIKSEKTIKMFFRLINQNREESLNHPASYISGITVQLFKIYFYMKKYKFCKGLRIQTKQLLLNREKNCPEDLISHFYYYCGVLDIINSDFIFAQQNLNKAYNLNSNCTIQSKILIYLIPINLLFDTYLNQSDFNKIKNKKYKIVKENYKIWSNSVKYGNFNTFLLKNDKSNKQFKNFIDNKFLNVIRIKSKFVIWKNVLVFAHKKWINEHCSDNKNNNNNKNRHQIDMSFLYSIFKQKNKKISKLKMESVLVELICSGKVRGYIAKDRCLVLSKVNPFPNINKF